MKHVSEALPLLDEHGQPIAPVAPPRSARAEALSNSGKIVQTREQRRASRAKMIDDLYVIGQTLNSEPMRPADKAYIPTFLVYAALPYEDQGTLELWRRSIDPYVITFEAGYTDPGDPNTYRKPGLPFGVIPRLFFSYIATRIVRSDPPSRIITFDGSSFNDVVREVLHTEPTGGPQGTITRFRDQITRILALKITSSTTRRIHDPVRNDLWNRNYRIVPVAGDEAFWDPLRRDLHDQPVPKFVVSQDFYDQCLKFPVPFNHQVEMELAKRHSCMAIDLYRILTLKQFQLYKNCARVPELITYADLAGMLGNNCKHMSEFRRMVANALQLVLPLYPDACTEPRHQGLLVRVGSPHVTPKPKRIRATPRSAAGTPQLPASTPSASSGQLAPSGKTGLKTA